jgi:hypothetical protein
MAIVEVEAPGGPMIPAGSDKWPYAFGRNWLSAPDQRGRTIAAT